MRHFPLSSMPDRRLEKRWDNAGTAAGNTKAIGTIAPTTIHQAHGISGQNGTVSFILMDGGTQNIVLYQWCKRKAEVEGGANGPSNGWVKMGNNVDYHTQSCDEDALVTFECAETVPFCLVATTAVANCIVSGQPQSSSKPNTDTSNT